MNPGAADMMASCNTSSAGEWSGWLVMMPGLRTEGKKAARWASQPPCLSISLSLSLSPSRSLYFSLLLSPSLSLSRALSLNVPRTSTVEQTPMATTLEGTAQKSHPGGNPGANGWFL